MPLPVVSMVDLSADYEHQRIDSLAAELVLSASACAELLHFKLGEEEEAKIRAQRLSLRVGAGLKW